MIRIVGSSSFENAWIALNICLASLLYLFDFVTNVLTAKEYYSLDKAAFGSATGIFAACVSLMVAGHILNAIIFKLTLPVEERPILNAYFFPIMQLWRLVKVVWSTCSCQRSLKSDVNPIYSILAVALEAGPQLFLQTYTLLVVYEPIRIATPETPLSSKLVISIIASYLSAAYNGALAVASLKKNVSKRTKLGLAVAGGAHLFASLLVRSLSTTMTSVMGFMIYRISLPFLFLSLSVNFAHLYFHCGKNPGFRWTRILECIGYSYVSISVGPLYCMVREESKKDSRESIRNKGRFEAHLLVASANHLLLDIIVLAVGFYEIFVLDREFYCGSDYLQMVQSLYDPIRAIYPTKLCNCYVPKTVYGVLLCVSSAIAFVLLIHNQEEDDITASSRPTERETVSEDAEKQLFQLEGNRNRTVNADAIFWHCSKRQCLRNHLGVSKQTCRCAGC